MRVYPRAGGGTSREAYREQLHAGLSPRRRGNLEAAGAVTHMTGSIPAQAGEPGAMGVDSRRARVYPRAGGGTAPDDIAVRKVRGLSPRWRGNRLHGVPELVEVGSIPAQAGEPAPVRSCSTSARVYPRAGGGTALNDDSNAYDTGLSPRWRGNRADCA